jgi:hypothetical protein
MFNNTKAFSGFSVDDVAAAHAFYGDASRSGDVQGGPLIAWFKDPAGNWLSVIQDR